MVGLEHSTPFLRPKRVDRERICHHSKAIPIGIYTFSSKHVPFFFFTEGRQTKKIFFSPRTVLFLA